MTVGSVLEQTFGLYQRFFWRFVAITAIVMVALDLVTALALDSGSGFLWVVVIAVSLVGTFWVQGALSFAVADVRDGSADSPIGELFSRTRPVLGTLILVGVLAAIGIAIGLILLIAPGLYLLARWALVVPAVVLEMLGIVLVTSIGSAIVGGIIGLLVDLVIPGVIGLWLSQLVSDCITVPFVAVALTVTYFNLVRAGEPAPEAGAEPDPAAA